jgi:hypothetical protein
MTATPPIRRSPHTPRFGRGRPLLANPLFAMTACGDYILPISSKDDVNV